MEVNLEYEAKVESDPAKLISDDSGSVADYINIKNQPGNQIWNTLNANVQFIMTWLFFDLMENRPKSLGLCFQWTIFEIIASLE